MIVGKRVREKQNLMKSPGSIKPQVGLAGMYSEEILFIFGTRPEAIKMVPMIEGSAACARMANAANPYANGHAAQRICEELLPASNEGVTCVC